MKLLTHPYKGIPTMTSNQVHEYLKQVGSGWTGQGMAVELGSWLGGSAVPLLEGLVEAGYNKLFWAFDKWQVNRDQIPKAKEHGVHLTMGQNAEPLFIDNVGNVYDNVITVKGGMPTSLGKYEGGKIEICIFDAPKQEPVFSGCINALKKHWIPGVTIIGFLDYGFYKKHTGRKREVFKAPVEFMKKYGDCFSVIKQWDDEVVVFMRYEKKLN